MKLLLIHSGMDAIRWMDRASFQQDAGEADVLHISATDGNIRQVVQALTLADTLIIPDDVSRCDHAVECIKAIARQMAIPVLPMTVWMRRQAQDQTPAAVLAEPQSQQGAVRGHNTATPCAS